jgi:hypothetical protein
VTGDVFQVDGEPFTIDPNLEVIPVEWDRIVMDLAALIGDCWADTLIATPDTLHRVDSILTPSQAAALIRWVADTIR